MSDAPTHVRLTITAKDGSGPKGSKVVPLPTGWKGMSDTAWREWLDEEGSFVQAPWGIDLQPGDGKLLVFKVTDTEFVPAGEVPLPDAWGGWSTDRRQEWVCEIQDQFEKSWFSYSYEFV